MEQDFIYIYLYVMFMALNSSGFPASTWKFLTHPHTHSTPFSSWVKLKKEGMGHTQIYWNHDLLTEVAVLTPYHVGEIDY